MGWGDLWEGAGDVLSGGIDVLQGGADFVTDVVHAATQLRDPGEAAETLLTSVQEDLVGQSVMGLFGPEGIGGTLIGGLPDEVRDPARSVITPTLEAWDWVMEEMVDNPLGTLSTVLYAQTGDGGHSILELDTWRRAWDINQTRSFGQSVAVGVYGIDPFDQDRYNEISEKPIFNLFSGTLDFFQEFLDPIDVATAGTYGLATGGLVVANRSGDIARVGGVVPLARQGTTRWVPRRTLVLPGRANGLDRGQAARRAEATVAGSRVDSFLNTPIWDDVTRTLDQVLADGGSEARRLVEAQRILGSGTRRLPEGTLEAIARAPSRQARDLNLRIAAGDLSAFPVAHQRAAAISAQLDDSGFMTLLDEFEESRRILDEADLAVRDAPAPATSLEVAGAGADDAVGVEQVRRFGWQGGWEEVPENTAEVLELAYEVVDDPTRMRELFERLADETGQSADDLAEDIAQIERMIEDGRFDIDPGDPATLENIDPEQLIAVLLSQPDSALRQIVPPYMTNTEDFGAVIFGETITPVRGGDRAIGTGAEGVATPAVSGDELARHQRLVDELAPEVGEFYELYNSVDARTLWGIDREAFAAQPQRMINDGGVYLTNPAHQATDINLPGQGALFEMLADDIIAEAEGWIGVSNRFREITTDADGVVREAATRNAMLEASGLPGSFTRESRGPGGRPIHRLFERHLDLLNRSGDNEISDVYRNPSVVGGTNRFVRYVTAKTPQFLFDVTDQNAIEQFRRMLTQASEVVIDTVDEAGNSVPRRLLDDVEAAARELKMERLLTEGDATQWSEAAMQHFRLTVNELNTKLDEILKESFGGNMDSLRNQYDLAVDTYAEKLRDAQVRRRTASGVMPGDGDQTRVTYSIGDEGGEHIQNLIMSPSQAQQSMPMPRFDLVNNEIRRIQRLEGGGASHYLQVVKDKVTLGTRPAREAGASLMSNVWKPAVLLTPKWPMRVGIDEQLRMMSHLGAVETITNLVPGMNRLRQVYGAKIADTELRNVMDGFLERFDELVAKNGGDPDVLELGAKVDLVGGRAGIEKLTADMVKEQIGFIKNRRMTASAGLRGAVVGSLFTPPAGFAYAAVSGMSRRRRVIQAAQRQTALNFGDALLTDARRILNDAVTDPDSARAAEHMLARGESIVDMVTADAAAADVPQALRSQLDTADELMREAGMGSLNIGGSRVTGAFGDSTAQIERVGRQVSAGNGMHRFLRGAWADTKRSFEKYESGIDWMRFDVLDTPAAQYQTAFSRTANIFTPQGKDFRNNFYNVVWSEMPVAERAQRLAANFATDPNMRLQFGLPASILEGPQILEAAEIIVTNYDNFLPRLPEFMELRNTVRSGGKIEWSDVQRVLEDIGGDDQTWQQVLRNIREGNGVPAHPGFGRSISPDPLGTGHQRIAGVGARVNSIIESLFESYGTFPTDELARSPFFRSKYEAEVTRRLEMFADPDGQVRVSQGALDQVEKASRDYALERTRDLLYDLAEETRLGEVTGNIMPFYNAWQEVLSRWVGLTVDNPYFTAKMIRLYQAEWNAPTLGIEEVFIPDDSEDPEGDGSTYLTFRLNSPAWDEDGNQLDTVFDMMPQSVRNLLIPKVMQDSDQTIRFSKDGLNTMLQASTPGFGPLVTVPVSEAILAEPGLEEAFGFMFPFGHPEGGFGDRLMSQAPTWIRSMKEGFLGGPSTERVVQRMFRDIVVQQAEAGEPVDFSDPIEVNALIAAANQRAQDFNLFRSFTGFVSPTSTTTLSPYEPLVQAMSDLRAEYPGDERTAQGVFLERYGEDLFTLTARMTRLNDGVSASLESEEAYIEHQELIAAYPEIGGWLSNSIGATDEQFAFSQAAYRRQLNQEISDTDPRRRRERKSPLETVTDVEADAGWRAWSELSDVVRTIQAERAAVGLPSSLNSNDMETVRLWKRAKRLELAEKYPTWWTEYQDFGASAARQEQTIQGFMAALNDPAVLARPSTDNVIEYLKARMGVQTVLEARAAAGGSDNLEAGSNDDVFTWFEIQKQELSDRPDFSAIFDRYFDRDTVRPTTFYRGEIPEVLR